MVATRDGQIETANQLVGIKQDVDEAIQILDPVDVPLQQWLPTADTRSIKVEWLEEDLTPSVVTVVSFTGSSTPWTIAMSDTDDDVLRPGDVLHTKNAASGVQFRVTSIDLSAHTAVISGFAGNTTAPANADVLEIIGQYRNEGSAPEDARSVDRRTNYNYTQIGQEKIEATRTARKQARFADVDPYDHELMKKFKELGIRFERSLIHGQRVKSSDAKQRFMGGLFYYISTNSKSGTAANVKTTLGDLIRQVNEAGGDGGVLMCSFAVKAAIDANIDAAARRTTRDETTGGFTIEKVLTSFGEVDIMPNRHFPTTKGLILDQDDLARVNFDPYFHELLAKDSDADVGQLVGEFTLRVKNDKAHGVLTVTDAA